MLLAALFFVAAVLYSAVGHAGASGYLAAMALVGVAPSTMRPTALVLNLLVAAIAAAQFARAGFFSWRLLWPFALGSVPLAYMGGTITLPGHWYNTVVGVLLLIAGLSLLWTRHTRLTAERTRFPPIAAIACGALIGLLSGLTGTGGGIFLSPLLLLTGWADARETGAVAATFILVNSAAALAGNLRSVGYIPSEISYWAAAAVLGGLVGSQLGSRYVSSAVFRTLLALVLFVSGGKLILT